MKSPEKNYVTTITKSIAELIDLLTDTNNSDGDTSYTFTDENGNVIHMELGDCDGNIAALNLNIKNKKTNISITIKEPQKQLLAEIEQDRLLNGFFKEK